MISKAGEILWTLFLLYLFVFHLVPGLYKMAPAFNESPEAPIACVVVVVIFLGLAAIAWKVSKESSDPGEADYNRGVATTILIATLAMVAISVVKQLAS